MRKVTRGGTAWGSPHRQRVDRLVHGKPRGRVKCCSYWYQIWFRTQGGTIGQKWKEYVLRIKARFSLRHLRESDFYFKKRVCTTHATFCISLTSIALFLSQDRSRTRKARRVTHGLPVIWHEGVTWSSPLLNNCILKS